MYGVDRAISDACNHDMKCLREAIGLKELSLLTSVAAAVRVRSNAAPIFLHRPLACRNLDREHDFQIPAINNPK